MQKEKHNGYGSINTEDTRLLKQQTQKLEEGLAVLQDKALSYRYIRLFRIDKFIYDSDEDVSDKLISVYGVLNTIYSSIIIVIKSDENGITFFMGTRCSEQPSTAGSILENAINSNLEAAAL